MYLFFCSFGKSGQNKPICRFASLLRAFCFFAIIFIVLLSFGSTTSFASRSGNDNQKQIIESDTSVVQLLNQYLRFILVDGTEFIAKIDSIKSNAYYVKTQTDLSVTIPIGKIKEIKKLKGQFVEGEYRRFDPNRTRLLFAPTARALESSEGYFSAYEIFFPMITYAPANFMTISFGISLLPGASKQLLYGNLKFVPFQSSEFSFAFGGLIASVFDEFRRRMENDRKFDYLLGVMSDLAIVLNSLLKIGFLPRVKEKFYFPLV